MRRGASWLFGAAALLAVAGCGPTGGGGRSGRGDSMAVAADTGGGVRSADSTAARAGAAADHGAVDTATAPGPPDHGPAAATLPTLVGVMRGLQGDLDRMSHGLWQERYDSVAVAAGAVADHPSIPAGELAQITAVLGTDTTRFRELGLRVRAMAKLMEQHARARDLEAMLATDAELRRACVECHRAFVDRLSRPDTATSRAP